MLTLLEVSRLAGIAHQVLLQWVDNRFIIPAKRGRKKKGFPSFFTERQAIGICIANVVRHSEQGCSRAYVRSIIQFFEGMSDDQFSRWMSGNGELENPSFVDVNAPELPGVNEVRNEVFRKLADVEAVITMRKNLAEKEAKLGT
jgi:hypothetical protein